MSKLDELMLDCFIEGGDHWPAEMFTKNQTPASSLQLLQQVTIPLWDSSDESLHCLEPRGREIIVVQEVGVNHLSITQWKVSILCLPGLILTIPTAKESLGEFYTLLLHMSTYIRKFRKSIHYESNYSIAAMLLS